MKILTVGLSIHTTLSRRRCHQLSIRDTSVVPPSRWSQLCCTSIYVCIQVSLVHTMTFLFTPILDLRFLVDLVAYLVSLGPSINFIKTFKHTSLARTFSEKCRLFLICTGRNPDPIVGKYQCLQDKTAHRRYNPPHGIL